MSKSKQLLYICPHDGFKAKNRKHLVTHVVLFQDLVKIEI